MESKQGNIILGIDPGLQKTGWGIIRSQGNRLSYIASGTIRTNAQDDLARRLAHLHAQLSDIIVRFAPDSAAIEETFVNKNPASALKLGQARGALMAVPALHGLEVYEYSANKVKKSVVGTGHAAKQQIGLMVRTLLPACGTVGEDEADSLAVAITHAHYGGVNKLLSKIRT